MTLKELLAVCDRISPFDERESWDNGGLIIGDPSAQIGRIAVALEADRRAIDSLPLGAALIVHHPLIFAPIKSLDFSKYPALLIRDLVLKDAALIAMHTNFDKHHLNRFVAQKVLGWREFTCEQFACFCEIKFSFEKIVELVGAAFGGVKSIVEPERRKIYRVAFCSGSGGGMIGEIACDILITGDLKYH
ncbi:MAG: Nif3-like dinuclear metal center hexameric protein, partial [Helicobacteraceae bacterium]|nr:Nif3-like dinuclear metal center hexameric protein [Helicobacteraceae bacterium]